MRHRRQSDFSRAARSSEQGFPEQLANEVKYFSFQASNGLSDAIRQDAKEELALVKKFIGRPRLNRR